MKRTVPAMIAFGLIIMIALGVIGVMVIQKYAPSKEMAVLSDVYEAGGDEIAFFYNYELQDEKGIYKDGQSYLPLTWVNANINKRFYWDSSENLLVYALPDQIVYADPETKGANGFPLLLVREDDVYLMLGLIANYTDVQLSAFNKDEVKRVYITDWGTRTVARVRKNGKVRERGGIKSSILTDAVRDTQVTVLNSMEKWSKVLTPDGHIGYVQNKLLTDMEKKKYSGSLKLPEYHGTKVEEKIVLGWHQVASQEGNKTLESVAAKTRGLNVISPTWFSLTDNDGNYKSLGSRSYVEKAHEMGLQVWGLLDNFSKEVQTEKLLASTATRRKLINSLIMDAETLGLDGLNMDFEGIKPEAGVHYIQFLRELSIPCREKGIILSVDNYVPTGYNQFYDREEQGIVADYVIIMGYDEHYAGGEAGSVASYEYVKNGIEGTLKAVPREKVINGVPFYTRLWTESPDGLKSSAIGIANAKEWIRDNQVELYWQEALGQYYGEFESSDGLQYIWMEEEDSLKLKMDLIKENDLAGVACWKLGLEDEAVWESLLWD